MTKLMLSYAALETKGDEGMLGFLFLFIMIIAAIGSKMSMDISDYKLHKDFKNNPECQRLGVVPSRGGLVDINTRNPVIIYKDKNGHQIKKDVKTGKETDCSVQYYNELNTKRLIDVIEKGEREPDKRYVNYSRWTEKDTEKEGVYGYIYIDKENIKKKYVKRCFTYEIDGNVNEKLGYSNCRKQNVTDIDRKLIYFCCLMDIDTGKIIGLTEDSWEDLQKEHFKYRGVYDKGIEAINRFIDLFNEAQDNEGFYNLYQSKSIGALHDLTEVEKFYCSSYEFIGIF